MSGANDEPGLEGTVVGGRWRLGAALGSGGMGDVFHGQDMTAEPPQGRVAVKVVSPGRLASMSDPGRRTLLLRFEREAAALQSLQHPFTVRCFDHGVTPEGMPWMVLELLEGRTVGWVIRRYGRIEPPQRVAHIARQVALSLAEAHALGIVHRDVKPDNMHIQDPGELDWVRLFDFGVARSEHEAGDKVTAVGATVGTVLYMAPEQARALNAITGAADFYALGVSVFEMLTGRTPYLGGSDMDVLAQHVHASLPQLDVPGMEEGLVLRWQALIHALMAKDVSERLCDGIDVAGRFLALAEPQTPDRAEVPISGGPPTVGHEEPVATLPRVPQAGTSASLVVPVLVGLGLLGLGLFGLRYFLSL